MALIQPCQSRARSRAQGERKSLARASSRMLFTCLNLQDQALVIGRKGDGQDKQVLHEVAAFGRGLLEATSERQAEPSREKAVPLPGRCSRRRTRAWPVTSREDAALLKPGRAPGSARLGWSFCAVPNRPQSRLLPPTPGPLRSRRLPRAGRQEG